MVRDGSVGDLAAVCGGEVYDAVLFLGVLMYLPASQPVIAELAAHVAPGGFLTLAVRTTTSAIWRPAARQDWQAALAAFSEYDLARAEGRDMRYINDIGTPARADDLAALTALRPATSYTWRTGKACGSPSTQRNSIPRRPRIPASWPRCWTSKNAWALPIHTGTWANSRT